MAKFKITIRPSEKHADGTVNIKILITHNRKSRYISTDYDVLPEYFDIKTGTVKPGGKYDQDDADHINNKLQIKLGVLTDKVMKQRDVRFMDLSILLTILRDTQREYDLFSIFNARMDKFKKIGNINYHDTILRTKRAVEDFCGTSLLPFDTISPTWLSNFEYHLRSKGLKPNTIGIHMRDIRTAYNQAITMGLIDYSSYPFRKYKIPKEKTRHRTLSPEEIATIAKQEIKKPLTAWARDMFMLSFYLIGINLKDMMFIEKVEDGRIYYIRSKGKKSYSIKVHPEAQEIINRYPGKKYLLDTMDRYKDYREAVKRVNYKIRDVAESCKINKHITTYWCRHSWATIAMSKEIGASRDDIRYALGHATNTVSDIYIEIDQEVVDNVNRKVIDLILRTPPSE